MFRLSKAVPPLPTVLAPAEPWELVESEGASDCFKSERKTLPQIEQLPD